MRWEDVNMEEMTATIRGSKTAASAAAIPLTNLAGRELMRWYGINRYSNLSIYMYTYISCLSLLFFTPYELCSLVPRFWDTLPNVERISLKVQDFKSDLSSCCCNPVAKAAWTGAGSNQTYGWRGLLCRWEEEGRPTSGLCFYAEGIRAATTRAKLEKKTPIRKKGSIYGAL